MQVVERFEMSKKPGTPSDDVVLLSPDVAAVIDGCTDKSGLTYSYDGATVSSGRFAALVVRDAIEVCAARRMAVPEMVEAVTQSLRKAVLTQRPQVTPVNMPAASVVAYLPYAGLVWRVGDCSWRHGNELHIGFKDIDAVTANMRAAVTLAYLAGGASAEDVFERDPGREAILELLRQQAQFANRLGPFGYGVFNGTPVPSIYVEVTEVAATGDLLVLTSDGYPVLAETLAEAEERLDELLTADPLCVHELRGTKALAPGAVSFDDRSFVSVVV